MTTPHETSFVSNQATSTPTLKDSSRTTTKSSTTAYNLSKDDDQSNPCKSLKLLWRIHVTMSYRLPLKSTKSRNFTNTMCSSSAMAIRRDPLLLFQKLKEAHQNPVFTLCHIKDIEKQRLVETRIVLLTPSLRKDHLS
ncbi:hypothetical protein BY996DRAFT_6621331 [Phakopsora pachyrhizi]|uniref:Uncharacterized protein n=1 Tax=Phakopsora pachyrhizi TaxID=170000 RepID=A0AAV0B3Y7_PHAPC|nr:hypothetical protein BY996DRAFT_6621331 [Phakopsora pachyrhizi]CAH7681442.1 hypothetical protein PPACK8108_LOCUS14032 [Phakopsora pachyrhizi]